MITAVEGGHVDDIGQSNSVIRQIVEERNKARAVADESIVEELRESLDTTTSLPGLFDSAENPKDLVGSSKLPLHLWPTSATAMGSIAMLNGTLKYGRANWRATTVRASIYVDACHRHLAAWFEGHEADEEGVPHLSSALACLAIIVDARAAGTLRDDRQVEGGYRELLGELTPLVGKLRKLHEGKKPKHFTIADHLP
jgi:hypothetical protein